MLEAKQKRIEMVQAGGDRAVVSGDLVDIRERTECGENLCTQGA